jgi:hypothetical protein
VCCLEGIINPVYGPIGSLLSSQLERTDDRYGRLARCRALHLHPLCLRTRIRHTFALALASALPIRTLSRAMIQPAFLAFLMPSPGRAYHACPALAAALQTAVALPSKA